MIVKSIDLLPTIDTRGPVYWHRLLTYFNPGMDK